jgi:hypothetical protein
MALAVVVGIDELGVRDLVEEGSKALLRDPA